MNASAVVIFPEFVELALKIMDVPEWHEVKEFPPHRPDEPFYKGVCEWHVGNGLDVLHFENPKICLPSMKLIERVVIAAEVAG